jgi:hypothetical protein
MINVTLTFSGLPELMNFFASIQAPASGVKVQPAAVEVGPAPKPKKAAPSPAPVEEAAPAPATAAPAEAPVPAAAVDLTPEPEVPGAPQVQYADLQKAVLALYKIDRAKAAAIATGMGYESFKVMPAERWAEALEQVNANLKA